MTTGTTIQNTIDEKKATKLFWTLLGVWIICDLFLAFFMEIMADESYYALFGQNLAWGYYDHPPMVAVVNFLSHCLFSSGNLSARFINVLMHAASVWMIWKMIPGKKTGSQVWIYFAIAFSLTMFSAYGFLTTPDGSLIFFTSAFLLFYKRFLEHESWATTFGLALAATGMFYSKYHAVLVIGLIVLSNLRLLRNLKFWGCVLMTLLFLLPHIHWQISNDFPSLKYHLISRNHGFLISNLLSYFPEQLAVYNPAAFIGILYILRKKQIANLFDRALVFLVGGILIFFLLMTFKGRVEPHWTTIASVPMILLLYKTTLENPKFRKPFLKGTLWMLPIVVIARICLATGFLLPHSWYLSGKEPTYTAIEKAAGNLPVAFAGTSFQDASIYAFVTGHDAFTLSSTPVRTTQFDIWGFDKKYQDSTVFIHCHTEKSKKYAIDGIEFYGLVVQKLQTTNQIRITYSSIPTTVYPGDTLKIQYTLTNPYRTIDMNHAELPISFCSVFYGPEYVITTAPCDYFPQFSQIKANETIHGELTTVVPSVVPSSEYLFGLSLKTSIATPYNSPYVKMEVLKR